MTYTINTASDAGQTIMRHMGATRAVWNTCADAFANRVDIADHASAVSAHEYLTALTRAEYEYLVEDATWAATDGPLVQRLKKDTQHERYTVIANADGTSTLLVGSADVVIPAKFATEQVLVTRVPNAAGLIVREVAN